MVFFRPCGDRFRRLFRRQCRNSPPPATEPVVLTTPKVTFTVTETSVAFSWEAVEHASGYEYRLQKASETVKEAKVDAETLQALVDVPKGSEIYILKVRALGTGDYTDSEWSRNTGADARAETHEY